LVRKLDEGKRIAVFTNSLADSRTIEELVSNTTANYKSYSSEKPVESVKRKHFADVNKYWSKYDVIICTPTVSAGLSFEKEHFDCVFGYFVSDSCNAETCQQMLGRVRNVGDGVIYVTLPQKKNIVITSVPELEAYMVSRRSELMANIKDYAIGDLNFELDSEGLPIYAKDFRYYLTLENICYDNHSKKNFEDRFKNILRENRYNVDEDFGTDVDTQALERFEEASGTSKEIIAANVKDAVIITKEQYQKYSEMKRNCEDISMSNQYEIEKYRLVEWGKLTTEFYSETILTLYKKDHNWSKFFRSRDILSIPGTWDDRIIELKRRDIHRINHADCIDLNRDKFPSLSHETIKKLIEACNFVNIGGETDPFRKLVSMFGKSVATVVDEKADTTNFCAVARQYHLELKPTKSVMDPKRAWKFLAETIVSFYLVKHDRFFKSISGDGVGLLPNYIGQIVLEVVE
jgi:PHD/YefM family antitoxin component YafN of YafNO toxin-antitoxin module